MRERRVLKFDHQWNPRLAYVPGEHLHLIADNVTGARFDARHPRNSDAVVCRADHLWFAGRTGKGANLGRPVKLYVRIGRHFDAQQATPGGLAVPAARHTRVQARVQAAVQVRDSQGARVGRIHLVRHDHRDAVPIPGYDGRWIADRGTRQHGHRLDGQRLIDGPLQNNWRWLVLLRRDDQFRLGHHRTDTVKSTADHDQVVVRATRLRDREHAARATVARERCLVAAQLGAGKDERSISLDRPKHGRLRTAGRLALERNIRGHFYCLGGGLYDERGRR